MQQPPTSPLPAEWSPNGPVFTYLPPGGVDSSLRARIIEYSQPHVHLLDIDSRLHTIEGIVDANRNIPFSLALQAKLYRRLYDFHGALSSANRAAGLLAAVGLSDPLFDQWRQRLAQDVAAADAENNNSFQTAARTFRHSSRVTDFSSYTTSHTPDLSTIASEWTGLKNALTQGRAQAYLARVVAIESSHLERVFELKGRSEERLIRVGFIDDAIEGLTPQSEIQSPVKVVQVLRSFQDALFALNNEWQLAHSITDIMILRIQKCIVTGTRVRKHWGRNGSVREVAIPNGTWRHAPVVIPATRVLFHHQQEVPSSITSFQALAQPVLVAAHNGSIDPYSAAAWLHHILVSIHPFDDGNGRTTRLVASIPLMLRGLPVINVFSDDRQEYFSHIETASSSSDLRPLAKFFLDQARKTIKFLHEVNRAAPANPDEDLNSLGGGTSGPAELISWELRGRVGPVTLDKPS